MTSSASAEPLKVKQASGFDLSQLTHPIFRNARLVVDEPADEVIVRRRMYQMGERHFALAPGCVENGWSVYPQTNDGARRPAVIDGQSVRPSEFRDAPPPAKLVDWWVAKTPSSNVAIQLIDDQIALDIDVDDRDAAYWITGLVTKHLGYTPLRRQGRDPRLVLFFRLAPGQSIRSRSYRIAGSDDAIEVLAAGKSVTAFGVHHKTGDYFRWFDKLPTMVGPEAAPVVTVEQITALLDDIDHYKELQGYRAQPVTHFSSEAVDFDGVVVSPRNRMDAGVWERHGLGKLLVDGRSEWLFRRAGRFASLNADALVDEEGCKAVHAALLGEALRYIARTEKWSSDAAIETAVADQFKRARSAVMEGRLKRAVVSVNADGTRAIAAQGGVLAIGGDLGEAAAWIPPAGSKSRRKSPTKVVPKIDEDHKPCPERAKRFALLDSAARIDVGQLVSAEVTATIDSFLTGLWDNADRIVDLIGGGMGLPEALREVGALLAPTGAGKTSTLIRRFVAMREARGPLPFALGVYLPGHANTNEAASTAFAAGAEDVWAEVQAAGRGARVMVYRGKAAAGCKLLEIRKRLQDADISTGQMCKRDVVDANGDTEEELCVHYNDCPAIAQERLAQQADIILLPHAFLSSPLPKAVSKRIGAVVIDERFWGEFVKTAIIPVDTLRKPRKQPYLTQTDKRDGMTVQDYITGRDRAAEIATKAILAGDCPARTLASYSYTSVLPGRKVSVQGLELVRAAKTVCARAGQTRLDVKPNMLAHEVEALLAKPEGENVLLEWRFWSIVEEAILNYRAGKMAADRRDARIAKVTTQKVSPTGSVDDVPGIRISWRAKLLMSDRPAFLLDASADASILGKLYGGRPIRVHRVDAPLHLRCVVVAESFSDQSLLPTSNKSLNDKDLAAIKLSKVRNLITRLGGLYADQRILVGSTLPVEKAMKNAWASPPNVDFGHYGAFRGLDAYKNHTVALSIGRMELPVDVLDGLVAAFSYDDEMPEASWNATGTGWVDNQRIRAPKGERRLQRRDGAIVTIQDSVFPEEYRWHRIVQAQWREEELRQFAGRLRPVYPRSWTTEAPLWICAATCVPDGIVVDDVVSLDDLSKRDHLHEISRRMGGVIDPKAAHLSAEVLAREHFVEDSMQRMTPRSAAGYATVNVWTDGNPEPRAVKLSAWVPDMWSALYDAQRLLGHELDRYEVVTQAPELNVYATVPEPSKLERMSSRLPNAETATRAELLQERADAEAMLRERTLAERPEKRMRIDSEMILLSYQPEPEPPPRALAA